MSTDNASIPPDAPKISRQTAIIRKTEILRRTDSLRKTQTIKLPAKDTKTGEDTRLTTGNPKSPDTILRVNLSPFVRRELIVNLKSQTKMEALGELCRALSAYTDQQPACAPDLILPAIQSSEERVNTQIGKNWAIPHARVPHLPEPVMIVVGRSKKGVEFAGSDKPRVNLIVLLLAREDASEHYLRVLASIVSALRDEDRVGRLLAAKNERSMRSALTGKPLMRRTVSRALPRVTRRLIRHMLRFADEIEVGSVLLNIDAFDQPELLSAVIDDRTVLVTTRRELPGELSARTSSTVTLPFASAELASQLKLAAILAIGRGLISRKARILALAGPAGSNTLDQMRLYNAKDFPTLNLSVAGPSHINPGVVERVIELASTIAREGREGKAIGTIFVVGDENALMPHTRQLVINPFKGYDRMQLNVLDVTLEETVKEFAGIDGAFMVAADGSLVSAGTYLAAPQATEVTLQSGLGSRHRSAALMTLVAPCVAIAVSESTRSVSVFSGGKLVLSIEAGRTGKPS